MSPSPLPILAFYGIFIVLLSIETYIEFKLLSFESYLAFKKKVEKIKMGLRLFLFLLPLVGFLIVNVMLMPKMRWLLIRVLQPTYRPLRRDPSSSWDLMPAYLVRRDHWSSPCVPTPAYPVRCYRCRF
ncbi:unnamed protein product [Fraxinus pennsylvanica]|uniref:Uncharacterized protein n=1 Tax=Fraxinus pennsylvanica TaxID=56036 RepID=A0AAD2DTX9_9LAMI|nr:unnamed protein product [Fraxinus pennsylvanica]